MLDHSTLARFRSLHFAPCTICILSEASNFLYDIDEFSGEAIFIDGTKIEASFNKYTFVWKKAVTKNMKILLIKIIDFISKCNELYKIKKSKNITFFHRYGRIKLLFSVQLKL